MNNDIGMEILKSISLLIDKKMAKMNADRTYTGIISKVLENGYEVKYIGKTIKVKTSSTSLFSVGDMIKICIPSNNESDAYIVVNIDYISNLGNVVSSNYNEINNIKSNYVKKTGDTISGKLVESAGHGVHMSYAGSGSAGYIKIARITVGSAYQNQPIKMDIVQRGVKGGCLTILFGNVTSAPNTTLSSFTYTGIISGAYISKSTTTSESVWDLYLKKSESYDNVEITNLQHGNYMSGTKIEWLSEFASSLPSSYTTASAE